MPDNRFWWTGPLTPSQVVAACNAGHDPDTEGGRDDAPVEATLAGWANSHHAWVIHQALQAWRATPSATNATYPQGRAHQIARAHLRFWQGMARMGHAMSLVSTLKLEVPRLPTGVPGVLWNMGHVLTGTNAIGKPATQLRHLLTQVRWQPWRNHETIPGVPDHWVIALFAGAMDVQDKSRPGLDVAWARLLNQIPAAERAPLWHAFLTQAFPQWHEGGVHAAVHPLGRPLPDTFYAKAGLRGLMARLTDPAWQPAALAVLDTAWIPMLRGVRQAWRVCASPDHLTHHDAVIQLALNLVNLTATRLSPAQHDHLVVQICPFPASDEAEAQRAVQTQLRKCWTTALTRTPAVSRLLDPVETAYLQGRPEIHAMQRQALLSQQAASVGPRRRWRP